MQVAAKRLSKGEIPRLEDTQRPNADRGPREAVDVPRRVVFLWEAWTGYMDVCVEEFQRETKCVVDIVLHQKDPNAPFNEERFFGYARQIIRLNEDSKTKCLELVSEADLVVCCGWHIPFYRKLVSRSHGVRVLCFDNQWRGTLRQLGGAALFQLWFKRLFDCAFVPGKRQARFARILGFSGRVRQGHYSCQPERFRTASPAMKQRSGDRRLLFVGRLVSEKGIASLAEAWREFASTNPNWTLVIVGAGPLLSMVSELPRVEIHGFVQPDRLPYLMAKADAFILPSKFEPWGVVVHEAAAAQLPLLLSDRCGASDFFLVEGANGYSLGRGEAEEVLSGLELLSTQQDDWFASARDVSRVLAEARTPRSWSNALLSLYSSSLKKKPHLGSAA